MGEVHKVTGSIVAKDAYRNLDIVGKEREKSQEKLSSGYRINRGADDAAGLLISEKMRKLIKGLNRGTKNLQEGVSLIQVADGALEEVSSLVKRMNELAVQSANGTNSDDDRKALNDESEQLKNEIDRIMDSTTYNGIYIFKGEERETIANFMSEREHEVKQKISLVKSRSGDLGYFAEVWHGKNAVIADFSDINPTNIALLYDKSFSFVCHQNCGETFRFTLENGPNTHGSLPVNTPNPSPGTNTAHNYYVDISAAVNGADIVTAIMNTVRNNPISGYGTNTSKMPGYSAEQVSHDQYIVDDGPNKLVIFGGYYYPNRNYAVDSKRAPYFPGKVDFGEIMGSAMVGRNVDAEEDPEEMWQFGINIRPSDNTADKVRIYIPRFHVQKIRLDEVHIDTEEGADDAISATSDALARLNRGRSLLGAQQNRLESSIDVNSNTEENTQSSESKMRDTDIAKELARYTKLGIIEDAGRSVLAQAMGINRESVMSLLS